MMIDESALLRQYLWTRSRTAPSEARREARNGCRLAPRGAREAASFLRADEDRVQLKASSHSLAASLTLVRLVHALSLHRKVWLTHRLAVERSPVTIRSIFKHELTNPLPHH